MRHVSSQPGFLLSVALALVTAVSAQAQNINLYGWPQPDPTRESPAGWLGNDPIVGRLACPPLTRLNLRLKQVDDMLVRQIVVEGAVWRFELRSGMFWWSGEPVVTADLVRFLEAELERVAVERGAGLWKVPARSISAGEGGNVVITWKETPVFGPYVLNGIPFARGTPAGSTPRFECVGLHRLRQDGAVMVLEPRSGSRARASSVAILSAPRGGKVPRDKPYVALKTATDFSGNPWTRPGDDQVKCQTTLDLSAATMIAWNGEQGPTADPRFRRLLTQLVPRGALLRSGGASLGELLTAPIARRHPGYDARLALRPSDLDAASEGLTSLGYVRSASTALRKLPGSTSDLKLLIASTDKASALVEKVVIDAFQAVGVGVRFVPAGELKRGEHVDGILGTFDLDWPDSDLLSNFHSRAKHPQSGGIPLARLEDAELDGALERYSLSLTRGAPDFASLTAVHRRLYELEPVTVVMQHKACLEVGGGLALPKSGVDPLDPDWFRPFVFPANAE
jgi:hypothetical protein